MPKVSLSFPHQLGKEEAVQRIKKAIDSERISKAAIVSDPTEHWVGDNHVDFTMKVFTYPIQGTLDILDQSVNLTLELPMGAAMLTGMIKNQMQQEISGFLQ